MAAFVVAALVIAVLFADRIGQEDDLRRRLYQVALSFSLVLFVLAASAALVKIPSGALQDLSINQESPPIAHAIRERATLVAAAALALVLAGLYASARLRTLYLGILLAGVLLLLLAIEDVENPNQFVSLYSALTEAGEARAILFALVSGGGAGLLLMYGANEWERPDLDDEEQQDDAAAAAATQTQPSGDLDGVVVERDDWKPRP